MGYKKRMFIDKDSFKAIGWQSEYIIPKGDGIFGDRKPFTWHEFSISDGHSCINLDEKEAPVQQAAPVINIQNTQTQQAGKTVIVNGGGGAAAKPAEPAKPVKKKEGDEFKEKPAQW